MFGYQIQSIPDIPRGKVACDLRGLDMLLQMLHFPEVVRQNLISAVGCIFSSSSLVQSRSTVSGENPLFHTKLSLQHQHK